MAQDKEQLLSLFPLMLVGFARSSTTMYRFDTVRLSDPSAFLEFSNITTGSQMVCAAQCRCMQKN